MPQPPELADEPLRAELARAFQEIRPRMVENAFKDADLDPSNTIDERGQSALDMIRSNVVSGVLSAHRMLPIVEPDVRDDAARWLAVFHATYTCEIAERALALEAARR